MKWIAALLMILNVTVYLWATGRQDSETEITNISRPDVNKEGMLLLSETGNLKQFGTIAGFQQSSPQLPDVITGQSEAQNGEINASDNILQDSNQATDSTTEPGITTQTGEQAKVVVVEMKDSIPGVAEILEPTELAQNIAQSCYRLGPFKKEESWESALAWMTANELDFRHVTSESRELRAVRVYLGPYNSISAAESIVGQLKAQELDHFVYLVENGLARISLGYFTQEELAAKFITYLESINVIAKSQPEYRILGPFNWIEIPLGSVDESQVTSHNWIEPSVELSLVDC